jgi:arabinan endo-1,5-alpha-L-arabinosidase
MMIRRSIAAGACGFAVLACTGCGNDSPKPTHGDASTDDGSASEAGPADDEASVAPDADSTAATDADSTDATVDATTPVMDAGSDAAVVRTCGNAFGAGPAATTTTHLDIGVHDPSMIWDGQNYYLFGTDLPPAFPPSGGNLGVRVSPDILSWTFTRAIFPSVPAWITTALGSTPPSLWAPDISHLNGEFRVYYAGSTFGSNSSVIGLATTPMLDPTSPRYGWVDKGMVVRSVKTDTFNAIDPNLAFDENCQPWLAFGSFWSGIKMRKIDAATGMLATDDTTLYSLASRGGGAIEASSIIYHDGFFYLFVSFDACCKGTASTYRTMVGRGSHITGPYFDKNGSDMMTGAAEQLLASEGRYIGPGGGTAFAHGNGYLYAYHYYDGENDSGAPKLQVRPIDFDATDWPVMGDPLFP